MDPFSRLQGPPRFAGKRSASESCQLDLQQAPRTEPASKLYAQERFRELLGCPTLDNRGRNRQLPREDSKSGAPQGVVGSNLVRSTDSGHAGSEDWANCPISALARLLTEQRQVGAQKRGAQLPTDGRCRVTATLLVGGARASRSLLEG